MPVFNRIKETRHMIECLRAQALDQQLAMVVVNDGSTDDTEAYLETAPDVVSLQGTGSLWWGGGIQAGLDHILSSAPDDDWVLFVNNDTEIRPDFVQTLVDEGRQNRPAAIGSVIRDLDNPDRLLSIGPEIDAWRFLVRDLLNTHVQTAKEAVAVDALSGRGALFPVAALRAVGGMHPTRLPHYLADYEVSLRVRRAGWRLLVSPAAAVYSREEYGSSFRPRSLRERFWSVRSPAYLPALISFWWAASNWPQRMTMPVRALLFLMFPGLRKKP